MARKAKKAVPATPAVPSWEEERRRQELEAQEYDARQAPSGYSRYSSAIGNTGRALREDLPKAPGRIYDTGKDAATTVGNGMLNPGDKVMDILNTLGDKYNAWQQRRAEEKRKKQEQQNVTPAPGSFKKGGIVKKTGLAKVHKGEVVLSAKQAKIVLGKPSAKANPSAKAPAKPSAKSNPSTKAPLGTPKKATAAKAPVAPKGKGISLVIAIGKPMGKGMMPKGMVPKKGAKK